MRNTQRIGNSTCDGGRSSDRTSLADTLHTQWIHRGQGDGAIQLEAGKLRGYGHCIVRQGCRQKLAILTINDSLNHRLSNPLSNTAMNLAFNDHRVDLASTVVNCHVACNLCLASILVYLNDTDVSAERKGSRFWLPEDRRLQARLDTWMQRIRIIGCCRYLLKGNSFLWRTGYREFTILQRHIGRAGFQHVSRNLFHLLLESLGSIEDGRTT